MTSSGRLPVTGAWRPGSDPGRRRWLPLPGPLGLERGGSLPGVTLAYETWGTPNADRSNAILVLHALTGDSHAAGPAGPGHLTAGWWDGLIGPGRALDTDRFFVVCPNVLGGCQGTTGPSSLAPDGRPWGSRFPYITVRDQVSAEVALADELGIERWAGVIGGSMGGMRALEWAAMLPERVARLVVVAAGAAASAEQIALCSAQVAAIRLDPNWRGGDYYDADPGAGPHRGLGVARTIAHVSYRAEEELAVRFGRAPQGDEDPLGGGGRFAVESYLDHHADKLARRFDAGSYVTLTEAMNSHDVGRDLGGVEAGLSRVQARTLVVSVDSDRLYPPYQQRELAAGIDGAELHTISSPHGHDAFLIETGALTPLLAGFWADAGLRV